MIFSCCTRFFAKMSKKSILRPQLSRCLHQSGLVSTATCSICKYNLGTVLLCHNLWDPPFFKPCINLLTGRCPCGCLMHCTTVHHSSI
jgi:hypothetical protein